MDSIKHEFDLKIAAQLNISRSTFTKERINQHIARFEYAKTKAGIKDKRDFELLTRYDVIEEDGVKRLIKKGSQPYRYYCNTDELFDLIKKVHVMSNHGGEKRIMKLLTQQYANITMNQIKIFKSVCDVCKLKRNCKCPVPEIWGPNLKERFGSRGQINTIDFQSNPHKGYSYILHYFDLETKFSILRPVYSTQPAEIAIQLVDIFTIFGAPRILHSDQGRDFVAKVVHELKSLWPEIFIVQGKSSNEKKHDQEKEMIENLLKSWMSDHPNVGWSDCLKFVQLAKNTRSNDSLMSPFKAIFSQDPIIGLKEDMPSNIFSQVTLETEEDLEAILANNGNSDEISESESVDLVPANLPIDLKVEDPYIDEINGICLPMPDFLSDTNAMTVHYVCHVCNQTLMNNNSPTCMKCNNPVHDTCSQTVRQSGMVVNLVCNRCIEDLINNSSGKKREGSNLNNESNTKKKKDFSEQEIMSDEPGNELLPQLPEMLATFDTDTCTSQLFPNETMRGIFEQDVSANQFEVNCMPLFDS